MRCVRPIEPERKPSPGRKRAWGISLALHAILVLIASYWVVSTVGPVAQKRPNAYATGSGGGNGGERAIVRKPSAKPTTTKHLTKSAKRITTKTSGAQLVLPETDYLQHAELRSMAAPSKGFAGGAGGGIGQGVGDGRGGGNFVGRTVLGMNIVGDRIAVYLDNSPSMEPYLDKVEKLIVKQFPKADIFRYPGIGTYLVKGEFVGTSDLGLKETNLPENLSPHGREMLQRLRLKAYGPNAGGWVDTMLSHSNYDALVIFSDFADPIVQSRPGVMAPTFFVTIGSASPPDRRNSEEKAWEARWRQKCAQAPARLAPRLYLMSIRHCPHRIYLDCMRASGGQFSIVEIPDVELRGR